MPANEPKIFSLTKKTRSATPTKILGMNKGESRKISTVLFPMNSYFFIEKAAGILKNNTISVDTVAIIRLIRVESKKSLFRKNWTNHLREKDAGGNTIKSVPLKATTKVTITGASMKSRIRKTIPLNMIFPLFILK